MPERLTYALVSPVRDEADHIRRTLESVLSQTHRPQEWIVVDDGSTDGTRELVTAYAQEHEWIRLVDSGLSHRRARGAPIVQAFQRGRSALRRRPDVTVKLDGDLFLPAHYFAWVAETFAREPRAGIVGGVGLVFDGRRWVPEKAARHTVCGYLKAYRTDCLDAIGGLEASMGWDGIDEYAARARGWTVHVLTEVAVLHYRQRGSRQPWWRARWEEGVGNAYMGYRPSFLALRAGYRALVEHPPLLGGLVLAAGYAWSRLTGAPTTRDQGAIEELRREQRERLRALAAGRSAALEPALPGAGPAFWATAEPAGAGATARGGSPS